MTLSENFNLDEFRCRCGCRQVVVDVRLLNALQLIRTRLKSPVLITSAYRCEVHNQRVGGTVGSYHTKGLAADISGAPLQSIVELAETIKWVNGIGIDLERGFVHLDVREGPRARWSYKGGKVVSA